MFTLQIIPKNYCSVIDLYGGHTLKWAKKGVEVSYSGGPNHANPPPTDPDGGVTEKGQTESKQGGEPGLNTTAT